MRDLQFQKKKNWTCLFDTTNALAIQYVQPKMSSFEPAVIKAIIKNTLNHAERKKFEQEWDAWVCFTDVEEGQMF
jgi:hypothetical protein